MRGLTARTENPQTPKQASDHPSDHLMDFRAVTRCHRESAISMCPRFLNAMTRDVPSERLPKLDVAGSNPVGRSNFQGLAVYAARPVVRPVASACRPDFARPPFGGRKTPTRP